MGEDAWVVEAALQFVRQPLWTTPVQNFIDSNCASFDDEEELKLEYTVIHKKFQEMIEGILEAMLAELGVSPEILVEALQSQQETDKNIKKFLQYLYSLDDFRSFRAMMVKRNIELEAEAMEAWSKMQQYNAQQAIQGDQQQQPAAAEASGDVPPPPEAPQPTEDDSEAKELQLALQASLAVSEKIIKQAEVEDAELQAALALSLAEEKERMEREEAKAAAEAESAKQAAEAAKKEAEARAAADEAARAEADRQAAEQRQKEKEAELAQKRAQAEAEMKAKEEAVLQERKEKVTAAVAAAEQAREQEKKDPNAPAVTRVSLTEVTDKPNKGPAPLGEISGHRKTGGFGKFGALPDIQPSFSSLKAEASVTVKQANPARAQAEEEEARRKTAEEKAAEEKRAKEEMEARAKYMAEQRRKIIEAKKQKRQGELDAFAAENNLPSPAPAPAPTSSSSGTTTNDDDKAHQEMTRALMRRFKDDIVHEASKPQ